MTVKLTSNFVQNARGVTLKDTASVTWAINANTNEISATATGGGGGSGTVTSVDLADGSGTAIYATSGGPVTTAGVLTFTLKTQLANLVFAGPTSGGAAQPTFRGLVIADLPINIPNANLQNSSLTVTAGTGLSGGGSVSLGGAVTLSLTSPVTAALGGTGQTTYTVGDLLYASAATTLSRLADVATGQVLRSGGVGVAPAWGALTVGDLPTNIPNANLQNSSLTVTAGTGLSGGGSVSLGGSVTLSLTSPVTAVLGGTGQTVYAVGDLLYADTTTTLARLADVAAGQYLRSGGTNTAPAWATISYTEVSGLATVAHTGAYSDLTGTPSIPVGGNPTALVGLTAVNGSASTWMRSDGAPPIDVTISPTWTGNHHFNPTAGTAIQSTVATAGTFASFTDGTVTGTMNFAGTALQVGTTSAHSLTLNSNNTIRINVTSTGAIIVNKADSGTALFTLAGGVASSGYVFDASAVTSGYKTLLTMNDTNSTIWTNSASRPLVLGTNSLARITIAGAGGVTVGAPTSGIALTVNGVAGSSALQVLVTGAQIGSPTGGDQGVGNINVAGGYYINGVLQQTYAGDSTLAWLALAA